MECSCRIVSVGVSKRSISKILTSGVVLVSEEERMGGWERMICQVSDTDGVHGSVVFGVGRGVRVEVGGEVLSLSSSLSRPNVRPRPRPRPKARIRMTMPMARRILRRRDHGCRGLGFVYIMSFCDRLLDEQDGVCQFAQLPPTQNLQSHAR